MDDLVHFRTVDEVVVNGMTGEGAHVQFERKAIVDMGERSVFHINA